MLLRSRMVLMLDHVPVLIMRLITLEVVELLRSMLRHRPMVPMPRIVAVVHMPMEPMRPMEPGPSANEDAAGKPIGPVITIRCAVIRRVVKVPIRTPRLNTNANDNL
jgi:hypothetical protein